MCIRTSRMDRKAAAVRLKVAKIRAELGLPPKLDIFPGDSGELGYPFAGERVLVEARWGLVPPWADEPDYGRKNAYNARAETVAEKPTFREPFRKRRAIVPADAFYERAAGRWLRIESHDGPFALAALYEEPNRMSDAITYTLVTTVPNLEVAEVHDRMPVILAPEDYDLWLDPDAKEEALKSLLVPAPPNSLKLIDGGPLRRSPTPSLFDD